MDSILVSIKKLIGIPEESTDFDVDLIIHINSVFDILHQLGVGPADGFSIADSSEEWSDFIASRKNIECVKTYVYLKVKPFFDPATNSAVSAANERSISELEWRLNAICDKGATE